MPPAQCAIDGELLAQAVLLLFAWQPLPQGLVQPFIGLAIVGMAVAVDYWRQGIRLGALRVTTRKNPGLTSHADGGYRLSVYLTVTNEAKADIQVNGAELSSAWLLCRSSEASVWAGPSHDVVSPDSPATVPTGGPETLDVSVTILELCRERGRVSVADAVKVTGANRNTIKDHLKALTKAGQITKHGAGRGTWYGLT